MSNRSKRFSLGPRTDFETYSSVPCTTVLFLGELAILMVLGVFIFSQDASNETLFRTMEKTLCLLEMGFTENEISTAFESFGM